MVAPRRLQRRILMALATVVAVLSSVAVALVLGPDRAATTVSADTAGAAGPTTATTADLAPLPVPDGDDGDTSHVRLPRADDAIAGSEATVATVPLSTTAVSTTTTTITPTGSDERVSVQPEQCDPEAATMPVGVDLLAYGTANGLRLRSLDGRIDLPVPGTTGADLRASDAAWEPGGTRVAFRRSVPSAVVVADAATGCWRTLTPGGDRSNDQPAWSPDGRVGYRSGELTSLGATWIEATDPRTPDPARLASSVISGPAWAPDRSGRIAFVDRDGLKVLDPGSGAIRVLYVGTGVQSPSWSPDGSKLVFSVAPDSALWSVRADAVGAATKVSPPELWQIVGAAWSPDGSKFAFVGQPRVPPAPAVGRAPSDVWVMDADGGRPRQLTSIGAAVGRVVWSPDGRLVAYGVRVGDDPAVGALEVVDVVTGDRRQLVANAGAPVAFVRRVSGGSG